MRLTVSCVLPWGGLVICHSATGVERRWEGHQTYAKCQFTPAPRAEHEEP